MLYVENRREDVLSLSLRGVAGNLPLYSCSGFVYDFYRSLLCRFPHGVSAPFSGTTLCGEVGARAGGRQVLPAQYAAANVRMKHS